MKAFQAKKVEDSLYIIILAAGKGKRMHSDLPKVLHEIGGKPILQHIVETAEQLKPKEIYVVYGNGGGLVRKALSHLKVNWVKQDKILGTGHAVAQVLPNIVSKQARTLILLGDTPLVHTSTLRNLLHQTASNSVGLVTVKLSNPFGLGRIVRNKQKKVAKIVEEKEANNTQKKIKEVNTGIFYLPANFLKKWLPQLKNNNAQKEYYLTDIIAMAVKQKKPIITVLSAIEGEVQGVNDREQLAQLERFYQREQAKKLMLMGATLKDPERFDLRGKMQVGKDVTFDVNVILEGENTLGDQCYIGPHTTLKNVKLGNGVKIKGYSHLENATIGDDCTIGPFARIRPETILQNTVHIGNFVEVKNSHIQSNTKVNHLSYIGDAKVGENVNIGAGTITCNFDGAKKHQTFIEDDVFVGSNTALVAPIKVEKGATIGAGSVLTKQVPAKKLTLNRAKVRTIPHWKRPKKTES